MSLYPIVAFTIMFPLNKLGFVWANSVCQRFDFFTQTFNTGESSLWIKTNSISAFYSLLFLIKKKLNVILQWNPVWAANSLQPTVTDLKCFTNQPRHKIEGHLLKTWVHNCKRRWKRVPQTRPYSSLFSLPFECSCRYLRCKALKMQSLGE